MAGYAFLLTLLAMRYSDPLPVEVMRLNNLD